MGDWRTLKDKIAKETERIWLQEPEDLKALRMGALPQRFTGGQYWTVLDFANGMIRDLSMYTMFPILRSVADPCFTLEQAKVLVKWVHPQITDYLRYSNFLTLDEFDREFISILDTFETKEDFLEFYKVYVQYTNKLAAWTFHYMTWEVSALFPQRERSKEYVDDLARMVNGEA